jgi:multidrug efflux pump subunit AcrB
MWMVKLALSRPHSVGVFASLIVLLGAMSALAMRSDALPTVNIPVILVVWDYPGLPAEDMEKKIVFTSERGFSTTVNGITRIESESINGIGLIKIYFAPETDIGAAMSQINSVASAASRHMPPGTHPPIVMPYNAANVPVAQITISGKGHSEEELVDYAFLGVRLRLFTLPGTSVPAPYGGKSRQINVDLDPAAAAAHGCSARDVVTSLLDANPNLPGGSVRLGPTTYDVSINNSPRTIEEFKKVVVKTVDGAQVHLGDVANVYDGTEVQQSIVRVNGERATYLALVRKAGASTLAVVDAARELLPTLQKTAPEGINLKLDFDQSIFVRGAMSGVLLEGFLAAGLVAILILFALGCWRSVLVVATSIPLAICVALGGLYLTRQTLNVMTLGGLALAIGMLVDDATVEVENIHRNLHMGKPLPVAIIDGAQQIAMPTLTSTLCICVVFSPVLLLEGPARYLFTPLALAVVFAMLASYVLSRTLVPTLASLLLRPAHGGDGRGLAWARMNQRRYRWLGQVQEAYARIMHAVMRHRRAMLLVGVTCLIVCAGYAHVLGYEFFPEVDVGQMRLHVRAPTGMRLEETERITMGIEKIIRAEIPDTELDTMSATVGVPTFYNRAFIQTDSIGPQDADILISLRRPHRPTATYRRALRQAVHRAYPGTHVYFQPADIVSQVLNFGMSAPIDVQFEGKNLEVSAKLARELRDRLRTVPGAVDIRIAQVFSHPSLNVEVDRALASDMNLTQSAVAKDLLTYLNSSGLVSPSFWFDPDTSMKYLVAVEAQLDRLTSVADLAGLPMARSTPGTGGNATMTPHLGEFASITRSQSIAVVNHENVQRVVDVRCDVEDRDVGSVAAEVERIVKQMDIPPTVRARVIGQGHMMADTYRRLSLGLVLSVLLAYLIMVVLFQSWLDPLIVLGAVPGALAGVLVALAVSGTSLNVESFMGAVMATGLAVASSILVVSFANELRSEHPELSAAKAAIRAGATRMRPVLMTAVAMILGMIPMALSIGEGAEQNAPLGRAVIGGLVGATVATLFFVPILYSYLRRRPPRGHAESMTASNTLGRTAASQEVLG